MVRAFAIVMVAAPALAAICLSPVGAAQRTSERYDRYWDVADPCAFSANDMLRLADRVWAVLGLNLEPVEAAEVTPVHEELKGGLRVVGLRRSSPASRAGILAGDILIGMEKWQTISHANVLWILDHCATDEEYELRVYVVRDKAVRKGTIKLAPRAAGPRDRLVG
jgi:hypothetical protein